jgi:hypothetical protein
MKLRYLLLLSIVILFAFSAARQSADKKPSSQALYKKKLDDYSFSHRDNFKYFSKTKTSATAFPVTNNHWPEEQVHAYSILPDSTGVVLFAVITDESPEGDYTMDFKYYFDREGKTVAFERINRFYHSVCLNSDALYESRIFYYDKKSRLAGKEFSLTTPEGKPMDSLRCDFPYSFPYSIYHSWQEFKIGAGLSL